MGHIHSDGQHRRSHNPQISPQFLGVEHIPEPADHQEVIEVEIDAEQQHENSDHKLVIGISIRTYTEIAVAEATGASGAEGVDAGVKERHPSRQQQKDFQQRHDQVNAIENLGAVAHAADQLAHRGPRHLGPHQMHAVAIRHRKNCHHEDQYAHAAHPVGKAPPEQNPPAEGLHLRQDGGAGGGKTGNGLKQRVHIAWDIPREHKGQRTEGRHQNPRQRHDRKAVSCVYGRLPGLPAAQQQPHRRKRQGGCQKGHGRLSVQDRCYSW